MTESAGSVVSCRVGVLHPAWNARPFCGAKEFILQSLSFAVIFDRPNGGSKCSGLGSQIPLTFVGSGGATDSTVVGGMIGVPPDPRIHACLTQWIQALEGQTLRIIPDLAQMHQLWPDRKHLAGLLFASMTVDGRLPLG
jgi:hypothetical protein